MKKRFKTARVVVPVTPDDLKRIKALAQSRFTNVAEVIRQLILREVAVFEKNQKSQAA